MRPDVTATSGRSLPVALSADEWAQTLSHSPLGHVPPDTTNKVADDPRAAAWGRELFYDPRLSSSGAISCSTCHMPQKGFGDGSHVATGLKPTRRNAPTLWNVAFNRWQFWDGRADTLWAQAAGPIENDAEMGGDRLAVVRLVNAEPRYRVQYEALFGPMPELGNTKRFPARARPVTDAPDDPRDRAWKSMTGDDRDAVNRVFTNVTKAIAAFERTMVSRRSPFDVFVEGMRDGSEARLRTLPVRAQRGLQIFMGRGKCFLCHAGPAFSDHEFHNLGLTEPTPAEALGRLTAVERVLADPFRANGRYSDDPTAPAARRLEYTIATTEHTGAFKTPGLRNVARTAPYMHDGRFATLTDVVQFYNRLNQAPAVGHREETLAPLGLSDQQVSDVVEFLESLTDESTLPALTPP